MAEVQEIITRYVGDVDGHLKAIDELIAKEDKLSKASDTREKEAKQADTTLANSAQKRLQLLKAEEAELKRLELARKSAFTVKDIENFNQKIAQSKRNIDLLKGGTGEVNNLLGGLKSNLLGVASGIAAAFSVTAIAAFAASSVEAFKEAEVNANRLKFAVTQVGGEGTEAFEKLIKQSERLQSTSVFSDDDIQRTQTQLKNFGLLSDEIVKLTPLIVDLATASGKTLGEATDLVIQGINGQTRALKPLGLEFKNTGDKAENLAIVTEKLNKFQGASAEALKTTAGEAANAANRFGDLQERFGELIATSAAFKGARQLISDFIDSFTELETLRERSRDNSASQTEELVLSGIEERAKLVELTSENIKKLNLTETQVNEIATSTKAQESAKQLIVLQEDLITTTKRFNVEERTQAGLQEIYNKNKNTASETYINQIKKELELQFLKTNAVREEKKALETLIETRKSDTKSNLGKTDEQLAKEAAAAEATLNKARDEASKARLKALEDEKKVLAEIEKIKNSQLKDPVEQLEAQAKIDIQQIEETKATQVTKETFVKERTIKLYNDILQITKDADEKLFQEALKSAIEISEVSSKDATDTLKERRRIEIETVEVTNRQKLSVLREGSNEFITEQKRQLTETRDEEIRNAEVSITNEQDLANQKLKINLDYADAIKELNRQIVDNQLRSVEETASTLSSLADLAENAERDRIDLVIKSIEDERDLRDEAYDKEIAATQDLLDKKLISETTFTEKIAAIENKRAAANAKAEEQIKQQQLKAAKIAKTIAIFKETLALSIAIASENYAGAIIAAAELAITIARPLPAFKEGTKGKVDSGVGLVGEEGPEFRYLEKGTKIVPAKQTKSNKPLVDAMIDGNVNQYIFGNYVLPEMQKQKQIADQVTNQNFAENIANSMFYNTTNNTSTNKGLTASELKDIAKQGTIIKNTDQLGKAFAKHIARNADYRFM